MGYVECMVEMINAYEMFIGKPEGWKPSGKRGRGWEDNIRTDRRKIRWEIVGWIQLSRDWDNWQAVVNTVMNLLL
jgi:hypothetical protein